MKDRTAIAVDPSKELFEIAVEKEGRVLERKRLRRRQVAAYFSAQPAATVVMEACGTSHHWGQMIRGLGHRSPDTVVRQQAPRDPARVEPGQGARWP